MKTPQILIITTILFSLFVTQACDRPSNDMERAQNSVIEAERDMEIAQSEVEAEVRMYRQEIANEIRENNLAIAKIKEDIQDEKAEVREEYGKKITELENTNSDLKRQIDSYKVTSRNNWDDFKEEFANSMNDLGNSLDDFFSKSTTSIN